MAVLLLAAYVVMGPRDTAEPTAWFRAGSASAELIVRGQWWRAVTALTLHADLLHLFGNAVASVIFVTAVGRWLGAGIGAWLILLAGAGGNLITADGPPAAAHLGRGVDGDLRGAGHPGGSSGGQAVAFRAPATPRMAAARGRAGIVRDAGRRRAL